MRNYLNDDDDDSNDSDKSETTKNETCKSIHTATGMVKWAMTHNVWLSTTFKIECILGWGGCGVVLGATRRSNNEKIINGRSSIAYTPDNLSKEISLHQFLEHPNILLKVLNTHLMIAHIYSAMERFGVR
ncbi:hypothetical protein BASA83_008549 [Batrachochytrium salamandrivorans]|nr:hypothetical protein BASA83_008549 [Batrachochytrium salamandrivorans]